MKLAVFDFDGTLSPQDTLPFLLKQWKKFKYPKIKRYLVYASVLPLYLKYKLGKGSREEIRKEGMRRFSQIFSGMSKKDFRDFMERSSKNILPELNGEIVREIRKAREAGYHTVLLSGCYQSFLKYVGEALGIDTVLGTHMNYTNGCIDLKKPMEIVSGEVKTERLRRHFAEMDVNWKGSTAYADSMSDIEILHMVGKPVVVDPEPKLKEVAERKEWRIIEAAAKAGK
jgi:HAD superfamily hydrolase (TIGR01490 family)